MKLAKVLEGGFDQINANILLFWETLSKPGTIGSWNSYYRDRFAATISQRIETEASVDGPTWRLVIYGRAIDCRASVNLMPAVGGAPNDYWPIGRLKFSCDEDPAFFALSISTSGSLSIENGSLGGKVDDVEVAADAFAAMVDALIGDRAIERTVDAR